MKDGWKVVRRQYMVSLGEPYTNSVEVHPQPSNNRHPLDDVLVHCGPPCTRGVSRCDLAICINKYLQAKEDL